MDKLETSHSFVELGRGGDMWKELYDGGPESLVPQRGAMSQYLRFARPANDTRPIYYIGPFGSRVSFGSQQRRALNVVGALVEFEKLRKDKTIAIVGAGIAGITAYVALCLQGYKVHLFEKNSGFLKLQESSSHRYIHPTVNFWPHTPPSRTTIFPFFDWYSSDCPNVISAFLEQWDIDWNNFRRKDEKDLRLIDKAKHKPAFEVEMSLKEFPDGRGVVNDGTSGWDAAANKVVLVDRKTGEEKSFDYALIAIGFGREDDLGDTYQRAYWEKDELIDWSTQSGRDIVVSGAGDGGLIECLRLVYRGFKKGDFALDAIEALGAGAYNQVEEFKAIEDDAQKIPDFNARSSLFKARYEALDLNPEAIALLDDALVEKGGDEFPNRIRLVHRFTEPYELAAAPINRFLLFYAWKKGAIDLVHGGLDRPAGKFELTTASGDIEILGEPTRVIVRHGPVNALEGFLSKTEAANLRQSQQAPGDLPSDPAFFNEYFLPDNAGYPCLHRAPTLFAVTRCTIVSRYLRDRFGAMIKLNVENPQAPAFEITAVDTDGRYPQAAHEAPNTIFGIPVRPRAAAGAAPSDRMAVVRRR